MAAVVKMKSRYMGYVSKPRKGQERHVLECFRVALEREYDLKGQDKYNLAVSFKNKKKDVVKLKVSNGMAKIVISS